MGWRSRTRTAPLGSPVRSEAPGPPVPCLGDAWEETASPQARTQPSAKNWAPCQRLQRRKAPGSTLSPHGTVCSSVFFCPPHTEQLNSHPTPRLKLPPPSGLWSQ